MMSLRIPNSALVLCATMLLAGCKIELATTLGGRISTESGDYSCLPSTECPVIDVSDTDFDQTFRAIPDAGYEFVGWRKRQNGFCGGRTDDCRLYTAGFVGDDLLMSILNSDRTFYLEAVFREQELGPGSGEGHASACWNALEDGDTLISTYRYTTDFGGEAEASVDERVEAGVTFEGMPAVRIVSTEYSDDPDSYETTGAEYYRTPLYPRLRRIGVEIDVTGDDAYHRLETYDPFVLRRFNLNAGQDFFQAYGIRQETTRDGVLSVTELDADSTITFLGIESVTVPAGTFDACRMEVVAKSVTTDESFRVFHLVTEWIGVDNGMLIKARGPQSTTELVSASINGEDL